ncbi:MULTISPECIES: hypothetical protein [Calothrix]|uniref:Type I restriction enzyme R protein N-terminal domain-containing protein n=2 Tax=Calothrix TaxID=1186 RepID=A0ABR8A7K8_9CYAN|nr:MULTISPECIES: hypothetical protein [Calothrix]MBD2195901.1 hypothetical protein [Calothrix parietina FACHB-288]MBD2227615.1 hypothetical protein [Calothrix anomala FACHB-343]
MNRPRILQPGTSYTFSKYFELPYAPADILAEFNCTYQRQRLDLPKYPDKLNCLDFLSGYLSRNLAYVNPISEMARREVLIAPTLLEICAETQTQLNIEYPINVNEQLKGSFDYYINSDAGILVIEAKQSDLGRGFTQLAVELIALDQWTQSQTPLLYGAVTTGEDWRFGIFHRQEKRIVQDLKLYRVPEELEELLRILVGIIVAPTSLTMENT